MNPDPQRVEAVFAAALRLPPEADRPAFLADACAGDPGLRRRVEALLDAHARAGSFLAPPPAPSPARPAAEAETVGAAATPPAAPGTRVRYFAGLSLEDAADALGVSRATASRDWT